MAELTKHAAVSELEPRWYAWWLQRGFFHGEVESGGRPFCIVMPPPNVTGMLHMGHALNNTYQDVLVRWHRMRGDNVVWVPGTDHAGIATQNVVEKALRKEGKSRDDLGREAFVERVWQWREQYGTTITNQLKRLGCSCDWSRERFTLDEGLSRAVAEVFIRLYQKKLIYRGEYIINWCPRCQTALADEEAPHREQAGRLYHIRYLKKGTRRREGLIVATTRPETLLGDTAVAVNPRDERYRNWVGKTLTLPLLNRPIPVIEDDFVDPAFGTGAVKVTPAHDPNDFEIGRRHNLPSINVMHPDGRMNAAAGPYAGLDRAACRERVLEDLEREGLLEKVEPHPHAVGHCYRCDTAVEPRLSPQWFVRMQPLAQPAIEAVRDGRIRFVPDRWTKVYLDWMEKIRDWCISRQIWWGHRIPVFTCSACRHEWAAYPSPKTCPACGSGEIQQDEDVLDTWFSSWLWPFSVFGWPDETPDLRFYYPSHVLVTAPEIIFFWVARMIMAGLEFMDDIPFQTVYIHGTVRDDDGRKMSKSLGNAIDPLTIIDQFGADALRFSLLMLTATGQDLQLTPAKFELGRNFGTKIWNAARFLQLNGKRPAGDLDRPPLRADLWRPDDHHVLARLNDAVTETTENLERFRFNDAAKAIYEFLWHQFCDWYLEYAKRVFAGEDEERQDEVRRIAHMAFARALRLLHPVMPFLTEELWHALEYGGPEDTIQRAAWPAVLAPEELQAWGLDRRHVAHVEARHELIRAGRTLRSDFGIPPTQRVGLIVRPESAEAARRLEEERDLVAQFLRAEPLTIERDYTPPRAMPSVLTPLGVLFLPLSGLFDVPAEIARINTQREKTASDIERLNRKLANPDFLQKAPEDVVAQQRALRDVMIERHEKLCRMAALFGDAAKDS